jgi:N-acetylneuraminic acid mutarotase
MSNLLDQRFIWNSIQQKENENEWILNRSGASLVYIPEINKYFLIGGQLNISQNDNEFNNNNNNNNISNSNELEVFIYDPDPETNSWTKMQPQKGTIPKNRSHHKCVYIAPYIFLFGGIDISQKTYTESTEDLYVLNIVTFSWQKISSHPSPSKRNDFQWIVIDNNAYLFGGESIQEKKYHNDLWCFTYNGNNLFEQENKTVLFIPNIWIQIKQTGSIPEAIKSYAMVYNEGYLYLFGGVNKLNKCNNKLYQFDLSTNVWELINVKGNIPLERCHTEMVSLNNNTLLLYGGSNSSLFEDNNNIIYNDIYLFNIKENQWSCSIIEGSIPDDKICFSLCCKFGELSIDEIIVLGGITKNLNYSEMNCNKIYVLKQDKFSQFYSEFCNVDYNEFNSNEIDGINDNFKKIIKEIEKEIQIKGNQNKQIKEKINENDKNWYQFGDGISEKRNTDNHNNEDIKRELKNIIENKNEKTLEFFNDTCNIFMNYYETISTMIQTSDENINMNIEEFKINELQNVKKKLEEIDQKEENLQQYEKI